MPRFPGVTSYDNIMAQHRLVTQGLGVEKIALEVKRSMAAFLTPAWPAATAATERPLSVYIKRS